jgi:chromosome segregation ATPase
MAIENENVTYETHESPRWLAPAVIVAGLIALGGVGTGWWAASYAQNTRASLSSDIQTLKQDDAKNADSIQARLSTSDATNTQLQDDLSTVTKRLKITQADLKKSRDEAAQIREDEAQKLTAMNEDVQQQLSAKASATDVQNVTGTVTGVRTDLDATRSDLDATKQNLNMTKSELGTLIAKNHDDVEQLRRLGERDYFEFTVEGKNKEQKVGSVSVMLRGTNPGKNQFSVVLVADDKRTDNRSRNVNQPIFFTTRAGRQPLEFVVNSVEKDKITGYVSIPKSFESSASASTTGSTR